MQGKLFMDVAKFKVIPVPESWESQEPIESDRQASLLQESMEQVLLIFTEFRCPVLNGILVIQEVIMPDLLVDLAVGGIM